ncbi:unnamed protein product [Cyclocybe aegerita]|uniref:Uncharacterized protein n=1 Tax=Cyclocybe aegerita TaxID=1973307 RepID=A0A8S0W628_CYCAE|nr:unnamed protein product [Cyclocybe aegerita]
MALWERHQGSREWRECNDKGRKKGFTGVRGRSSSSSTTRGPFFFTVETSHNEFLQSVVACAASGTHVPSINAINQSQLFWKLNVPANNKKKPLANVQGYRALILKVAALLNKKKDVTITIILPPLLKNIPSTSATSSAHTGEHGDSDEEELQDGSIGSSVREQKAVIGHANTGVIEQLRQLYPVGSNPLYPTKRVYTADGCSWELNDLRLQVWAMHLMADPPTATLDAPPVSTHFSKSQKLHAPVTTPASTATVTSGVPPIGATQPQMPQMLYSYPPYPFYPPYPYSQYPPPQPHDLNPHNHLFHAVRSQTPVPTAGPSTCPAEGGGSAPGSPLKITLTCPVSLGEFCKHYEVEEDDQCRLAVLQYQPGDRHIEKLEHKDWQGHAGFSKLAWEDVLSKHKVFVRDIKAGSWV